MNKPFMCFAPSGAVAIVTRRDRSVKRSYLRAVVSCRSWQAILGHSQISLTMDTYSTLLPSVSRDAADQMDKVLRA